MSFFAENRRGEAAQSTGPRDHRIGGYSMPCQRYLAALALSCLLAGCGAPAPKDTGTPPPSLSPVPQDTSSVPDIVEPSSGVYNPLTGLEMDEALINARPVAVMLNNIKQALPQLGNSQADIIYEVLAEGGITRMLGVYQSVEGVGLIGSVRSSRTYYLELALGHDAIYLHAGGSPDAYDKIKRWGVTALDCVNGPYEGSLFWRDQWRRRNLGYEHSVVTSGEVIASLLPTLELRLEHENGWSYEMLFDSNGSARAGEPAACVTVPFSSYKTGVFEYDEESGFYSVCEYGEPYIDGNTEQQVTVTNVIILKTACQNIPGDAYGRITVDLSGGGEGYYACGGVFVPIRWEKDSPNGQLCYYEESGAPLVLEPGKSYVCIVPSNSDVAFAP